MQEAKGGKRVGAGEEEEETKEIDFGLIPSSPIIRRKVTVFIRISIISLLYPTNFASERKA